MKNLYKNKKAEEIARIKHVTDLKSKNLTEQLDELEKIRSAKTPDDLGKPPKEIINFSKLVDDEKDMAIIKGLKKLVKDNEEQINLAIKNKNFQIPLAGKDVNSGTVLPQQTVSNRQMS